jgi:protein-S-isoprenylcysteine O-methyltransferase Ste14
MEPIRGGSPVAAPVKVFAIGLVTAVVQFGLSIIAFGGWTTFFSHRALIALTVITIGLMMVAPFTSGNLSSGEKEDRSNRWVFTAFSVIALLSAIVPPYTDRIDMWTIDGERTRWVGIALYAFGGYLRLWPVFVLGRRFSGLVAIQPGHTLETHGIYGLVRNPSYLGMLINMLGWGLVFRSWFGVMIAGLLLVPLVGRIRAEERLLRAHFGAEYETYCARTWRLLPGIY